MHFNYDFPFSPLWCFGQEIVLGRARAGCPCSSRVMAVVWNYFSRHYYLAGNRPAIICISCSSVGVFAAGRWVTFDAEAFYQFG